MTEMKAYLGGLTDNIDAEDYYFELAVWWLSLLRDCVRGWWCNTADLRPGQYGPRTLDISSGKTLSARSR